MKYWFEKHLVRWNVTLKAFETRLNTISNLVNNFKICGFSVQYAVTLKVYGSYIMVRGGLKK